MWANDDESHTTLKIILEKILYSGKKIIDILSLLHFKMFELGIGLDFTLRVSKYCVNISWVISNKGAEFQFDGPFLNF